MPDTPANQQPPVNRPDTGNTDAVPTADYPEMPTEVPSTTLSYGQGPPPRRRGGGCGCWIPVLVATFLATLLVIAGLFLPPVNLYQRLFGPQYVMLDAQSNAIADEGLTVVLSPDDVGDDFGIALESLSLDTYINAGEDSPDWVPMTQAALPPYLALQSPVYDIQTTGDEPENLTFDLAVPDTVANLDLVDVYGWYETRGRWQFIPSQPSTTGTITASLDELPERVALFQAAPVDPAVIVPVEITQTLTGDAGQVASIVAPAGLQPDLEGRLVGSLAPGFTLASSYRVMPVIRNFLDDPRVLDIDTVDAILGNSELRRAHVQQVTALAANSNFAGVFIDYRNLPVSQRDNFSTFIRELEASFQDLNLRLGVVVPAAENQDGRWETGAYDWREIGAHIDYMLIDFNLNPADFAPGEDRLIEAMLRWTVGEVNRYKLVAGLNARSVREVGGDFNPVGYDDALAALGNVSLNAMTSETGSVEPGAEILASLDGFDAVPGLDTLTLTPFIEYYDENANLVSKVWLTTADALRFRMDQMTRFAIGGVSLNDLVTDGIADGLLETVLNYKLQLPPTTASSELALRWRIEGGDGVVNEVITSLNEDLVVTLEAVEGNYAINVEVVEGESSLPRSGAAVAVFAPTSTPTPLPTATPTPEPTATPTLEPIIPTQPPANDGSVPNPNNPNPVNPGPGTIRGGFEYGGHVTSTMSGGAANAMRRAGMTWMKIQVRYTPGRNAGELADDIAAAKNAGFKVLLGTVGRPGDLEVGGGDYINQFAGFLGGLAGLGPDAIEVWNEPNIDREWPFGQISGANYTALLSSSYRAIKNANPGVMVISGAPAPTGAEAAFPGAVVNDDNFLRQMVDAGALQYMDCVGVHYNEGIVSPRQVSGDPRDNFYSRYYQSMENLYWNITGGQKPLCFTELGYLTSEGYGGLGGNWAWAQNTTVAQQAAWLAEAISLASNSGRVQLLIVWNVDFTRFDANDPQGGYAIIRPGGGCPACDAIANAR